MAQASLTELITYLAKELVDRPEEVEVREVEEDGGLVLELIVAESDLGKVIGKQGKTARALRTVLSAATANAKGPRRRVSLEILE